MPINSEIFENEPLPEGVTSTDYGYEMGYRIRKDLDLEECKAETTAAALKTLDAVIADYVAKEGSDSVIAMVMIARLGLADFDVTLKFRGFGLKTTFVVDLCSDEVEAEVDGAIYDPDTGQLLPGHPSNDEGSAE